MVSSHREEKKTFLLYVSSWFIIYLVNWHCCRSSSNKQRPIKCKALWTWFSEKHFDLKSSALSRIKFKICKKTSLSIILIKGKNWGVKTGGLGGGVHSGSPAAVKNKIHRLHTYSVHFIFGKLYLVFPKDSIFYLI